MTRRGGGSRCSFQYAINIPRRNKTKTLLRGKRRPRGAVEAGRARGQPGGGDFASGRALPLIFPSRESAPAQQQRPGQTREGGEIRKPLTPFAEGRVWVGFFFCVIFFKLLLLLFLLSSVFSLSGVPVTCGARSGGGNRVLKNAFPRLIRGIFSPDAPTGPITGYFCPVTTQASVEGGGRGGGGHAAAAMPRPSAAAFGSPSSLTAANYR